MFARCTFHLIAACAFATALVQPTDAAEFPSRPIRLVVPYTPGGPNDAIARFLADYLQKDLKASVVVENKPGAQGAIGAETVARAEPDGHTLFVAAASLIVLNPLLYKKLPYDPPKDFRMLAVVSELPVLMEVHPSVPAKTVGEFVAYAKQNPGKINYGSSGVGSTIHLAGEMFRQMSGIDMVHVPYKGAGPALADLIAGNVQVMFDTLSTALPPVRGGLTRPLGVSSKQRWPDVPEVPTIVESGYPNYVVSVWFGVAAPIKTPEDVYQKLSASINRALTDEAFKAKLANSGYPVMAPKSEAEIKTYVDEDIARWAAVIKTQNISLD